MMPSKIMDRTHLSQFHMPSAPSSFFSQELRFPSERQVGFWKTDSTADNQGIERMPPVSGSKPVSSTPVKKLPPIGRNTVQQSERPQAYVSKDQKANIGLEHHLSGIESTAGISRSLWGAHSEEHGSGVSLYAHPTSQLMEGNINLNTVRYENGLFSSSLSETFNKKLSLLSNDVPVGRSVDTTNFSFGDTEPFESLEEIEAQTIGNLLPDDEDLLSGMIADHDYISRPKTRDDFEDDLFCSGGGMELEASDVRNANSSAEFFDGETSCGLPGGFSALFAGEHPYGEHPSRTLLVRNINSNVENAELSELFEKYGDIRELYTMCKNRGFVMVSYYDARAACNAMRALQNYPLGHSKLDIHYYIPKGNPSEKDIHQGTLVVFNLDSSVSNDDLRQIFGVYGEVKEIRETPHKHHKFIEFYDSRAAEAALHALNKSDIAGKKIKLEPSRPGPGGARRCLMQQISPQLDREEAGGCKRVSPSCNSPPECFDSSGIPLEENTSNILDNLAFRDLHSGTKPLVSPFMETAFHGISSSPHHSLSSPMRMATVNSQSIQSGLSEVSHSMGQMNSVYHCIPAYHPHSLLDYHDGIANGIPFNSPSTISDMDIINTRPAGGIDNRHIHEVGTGSLNNHSFGRNEGAFGIMGNGSSPLRSHQYLMNSSDTYQGPPGAMMWQNPPTFVNGIPSRPPPHMHGFTRAPSHSPNTFLSSYNHHVGSAPAMNPSMWDRQHGPYGFHPASLGNMGFSGSSLVHPLELASRSVLSQTGGHCIDSSPSSAHARIPSPQQRGHIFHGKNIISNSYDAPSERGRSRRSGISSNQADNKKHYELDVDRIMRGEDSRTTLMLKNIPNKYTCKMLIATIDEHHRGTYDFIYLPIDFKNKCNVGYAFINMIHPQHIIPFHQAFNGKKWEKFNSEKVASLAYARIQGRQSLTAHFQNSSLMNEDKRCRPILFHTDGPNAGDQEPFPSATNIRSRPGRSRTTAIEGTHQGSPSTSSNGDESFNATVSSPVSNEESE